MEDINKEHINMDDTIVAIATPPGTGGIGIIRLSGPESKAILGKIFDALNKDINGPEDYRPRELTYGHIFDVAKGNIVDEVLACYMPAPNTYTKEDVVEINCHGGNIPLSKTLELILKNGARMAEPGEFTKRAFLNGRLDLSQAEAVIDVVNAKTEAALDAAMDQLRGKYSLEISRLREELTDVLVNVSVNIDYPDEDIEELTYNNLIDSLKEIKGEIRNLLDSSRSGKILREGLSVVIVGQPNVGKSSLMNGLLKESRAIVTEIPGTTRDTIEEFANIKGIPVKLTDTAGIRETEDLIEKIGIERSRASLDAADLILFMVDGSKGITQEDQELKKLLVDNIMGEENLIDNESLEKETCDLENKEANKNNKGAKTEENQGVPVIVIFNKEDKGINISQKEIDEFITIKGKKPAYLTASMTEKDSIKKIEEEIFRASGYGLDTGKKRENLVTNVRHISMLQAAEQSIDDAIKGAMGQMPLEVLEIDIASAYENLGFITGDSVREDIIDQVFSRFCLGK